MGIQLITLVLIATTLLVLAPKEQLEKMDLSLILNGPSDVELTEDSCGNKWALHSLIRNSLKTGLMKFDGETWTAQAFPCNFCLRDRPKQKESYQRATANNEGVYKQGDWTRLLILNNSAINVGFLSDRNLQFVNTDDVFSFIKGEVMQRNITTPLLLRFEGN